MRDPGFLNPLLAAYDQRVRSLEEDAAAKAEAVRAIEGQVRALVDENERLHADARRAADQLQGRALAAAAGMVAGQGADAERARLQERLDLLEQENDLLVAQQGELDGEVARLNQALVLHAVGAQELAAARVELVRMERVERDLAKLQAALKASRGRCKSLEQDASDAAAAAGRERTRADAAARAAELAADEARGAAARVAAAQEEAGKVALLQAECGRLREARDASSAAAEAARADCGALRGALRGVEARLAEYQRRDAEVYSRIREAMELAEEARLERDAALSAADGREREIATLTQRLADATRQLGEGGGAAEARRRADALERRAAEAEAALEEASKQ
ncbi:hypothetical protein MNEG_14937, partial [Monoraphidium neglectum]